MSRKRASRKKEIEENINENSELEIKEPWEDGKVPNFKISGIKFSNEKQSHFYGLLRNNNIKMILCKGVAGTGKTFIPVYAALKMLKSGEYNKIYYVRSPEVSGKQIGYLPGELEDKVHNFMIPLYEKLLKFISEKEINELIRGGFIETIPVTFIRGRSIENSIIIFDEAQNNDFHVIKTMATRLEDSSKIVMIGDVDQSDIGKKSGFDSFCNIFNNEESFDNGIANLQFGYEDVVRGGLCKYILETISKYNGGK